MITVLPVQALYVVGADYFVRNADVVLIVRASSNLISISPIKDREQEVMVIEVLKGLCFRQKLVISGKTLFPGQTAILLIPYKELSSSHLKLSFSNKYEEGGKLLIWPLTYDGIIHTEGIPSHGAEGKGLIFSPAPPLKLEMIKDYINRSSPEQVGLSKQVMEITLFPEKLEELRKHDAKRAHYIAIVTSIYDVKRDISVLAELLESTDIDVRNAAENRISHIIPIYFQRPSKMDRDSLHIWSTTWEEWWGKVHNSFQWNELQQRWELHVSPNDSIRHWPPVPNPLKSLSDSPVPPWSVALEKSDEHAFAVSFRLWLDSGVLRDRMISLPCALNLKSKMENGLEQVCGVSGGLLISPRLQEDLIVSESYSQKIRMYVITQFTSYFHHERFASERANATRIVEYSGFCSEIVRRAAFWEHYKKYELSTGSVALSKLSKCPDSNVDSIFRAKGINRSEQSIISYASPVK